MQTNLFICTFECFESEVTNSIETAIAIDILDSIAIHKTIPHYCFAITIDNRTSQLLIRGEPYSIDTRPYFGLSSALLWFKISQKLSRYALRSMNLRFRLYYTEKEYAVLLLHNYCF